MPALTADALARQYRDISVTLNDGRCIYGLDVHRYRNFELGHCVQSMNVRQNLEDAVAAVCPAIGSQRYKWTHPVGGVLPGITEIVHMWTTIGIPNAGRPFLGKGFIEDIQLALRLAVDFGFAQPNRASLQAFVDANIGIDCSGFASSFYRGNWIGKGATSYRDDAPRIRELDDIRAGDAFVWETGEHMGVIYSVSHLTRGIPGDTEEGVYCGVAEATPANLRYLGITSVGLILSEYRIIKKSDGTMEVGRPVGKSDWKLPSVRIVRP
jgi:hypothetical protein